MTLSQVEKKLKCTLSNFLSGKPCSFSLGFTNFLCRAHLTFVHSTFLKIIQSQDKIYPVGDLKFRSTRVQQTIHYQLASILTIFFHDPFSTEARDIFLSLGYNTTPALRSTYDKSQSFVYFCDIKKYTKQPLLD